MAFYFPGGRKKDRKINYVHTPDQAPESSGLVQMQGMGLGKGSALGGQMLTNMDGSQAMGDPMMSAIARRRQQQNGMMRGEGSGMLGSK